ncbi:TetR-like C-terminal domain-containing protein [Rossellomorea aquimaris]|uniref:TetR-like C-terminal domain-containing protein n=1 Tax=Rossellomorea aquimaris TaxID=189382 RepID=UPI0039908873
MIESLENSSTTLKPFKTAILLFEYLNQNSRFMQAVLGPYGDLAFQTRLKNFMWNTIYEKHSDTLIKEEKLLVPGEYLASYISSAHLGVIQQWLNSGRKESPEEMGRILSTITMNGPFYAAGIKN